MPAPASYVGMMFAVLFLLPIPISLVLAMAWAWWVSRPPRPADPTVSVEQWTRAIGALAPHQRTADHDAEQEPLARSA